MGTKPPLFISGCVGGDKYIDKSDDVDAENINDGDDGDGTDVTNDGGGGVMSTSGRGLVVVVVGGGDIR